MDNEKENQEQETAAENTSPVYGSCMRCGKQLTDPKSQSRGIGPICARYMMQDGMLTKLRNPDEPIGLPCEKCGVLVPYNRAAFWNTDDGKVWHIECVPADMIAEPVEDGFGV